MSGLGLVQVTCDGPRLGALACPTAPQTAAAALPVLRARLRRAGWSRRHHGPTQVDLCPSCTVLVVPVPVNPGGRPRKEVARG